VKKNLGIFCEKFDLDSIQLLQNKISCASQAAQADAIPDGVNEHKARLFIQAAIDSLGGYKWLEKDWWENAKKKYNLPNETVVWIDFVTGEFYINE